MSHISVKATQLRADADVPTQDACERAALGRALEAREFTTRVSAAARLAPTGHEDAVAGRKPK